MYPSILIVDDESTLRTTMAAMLENGDREIVTGSFLLFLTNLAGITLSAAMTFLLLGYAPIRRATIETTEPPTAATSAAANAHCNARFVQRRAPLLRFLAK